MEQKSENRKQSSREDWFYKIIILYNKWIKQRHLEMLVCWLSATHTIKGEEGSMT